MAATLDVRKEYKKARKHQKEISTSEREIYEKSDGSQQVSSIQATLEELTSQN